MSGLSQTYALAASWVNMLFFGAEVVLAGSYFVKSPPTGFSRWSLLTALAIDTACTTIVCYYVYYSVMVDPEILISIKQPWMLPAVILCTYHAAMVEQVFFTHRYWQITQKKITTCIASFLIFLHVAFAWILGIGLILVPRVTIFGLDLTTITAIICAATDVFITVVMFRAMRSIRSSRSTTQSLVHRVTIQTVACGLTTSTSTIIMLSLLVTVHLDPFTIVFYSLGRFYTLTILVNYIILRKPFAEVLTVSDDAELTTGTTRRPSVLFRNMGITRTFTVPTELSVITGSHSEQNPDPMHSKDSKIDRSPVDQDGLSTQRIVSDTSSTSTPDFNRYL
ncbi:hypothetical protein D9757_007283 [Collybiopsis confluens]|uniref:Uncharacterized protein n=1 Tax=Collybiopsis confluens TaxID=2823264 RepID=A0A8H5HGH4_9AGAR|nr:hypothetical protein D9757_007283 [Collybiopsis confluens]